MSHRPVLRAVLGQFVVVVVVAASSPACGSAAKQARADAGPVEEFTVAVRARHPHDPSSFTEGLVIDGHGHMFESVGGYATSQVQQVDPATGAIIAAQPLRPSLFGEGLAERNGELVQLTWKAGEALRWDAGSLAARSSLKYTGEGWGLTFDPAGDRFVQSDGSARLTFRDGATFAVEGSVEVALEGRPVDQLNELEIVDGAVLANVWHSDRIMRIDPSSGRVVAVIDASGLWTDPERTPEMVLNGIAHRPGDPPGLLVLTGKNWPWTYDVDLVAK